ncbi:hypothetical protein D9M68_793150 [compost metagenome]
MKQPKILYFIDDAVPTAEDYDAVAEIGSPVAFRNAAHIGPDDKPEACDAVAGAVPAVYKHIGGPAEAIKAWREAVSGRKASAEAVVGGEAPQAAAKAQKVADSPPPPVGNTGEKPAWGG